jgi:hypothetical protein
MTPTEARRDLPAISVKMPDGKTYPARVTGRLNQFPTVTISFCHQPHKKHLRDFGGSPWIDLQSTWEQVARCATDDKPIKYA